MLVQSPSRIYKADFSVWKKEKACILNEIIIEEASDLRKVSEIVLDESENYILEFAEDSTIMVMILYGEILINDFEKTISSEQVFTLSSNESNLFHIKNNLEEEKADVLIFEFKNKKNNRFFAVEDLHIISKNILFPISENVEYPNFIGLYEGRREQEYILRKNSKSIFGMVINGAFEFQNRLMESRDAIILSEIATLEFEALSENALLIFFEI
ncbi:hypothetical protein SAMN05421846_10430 [Chryseobacterium taeanense]|uniref:Quercetin 2,3-dioxygenase C-terminal cupin domain-containing protein n=1 Tax=Chryseobacterium taeanense TaxID=311334 RepID=A0A1G8HPY8_9FLAO|nr:hypothetical protein [Chryseobacterium taeanense]SDI08698.1 hypothetical protein SAMN05421846_10430 [Chryseobacterium taeanense]